MSGTNQGGRAIDGDVDLGEIAARRLDRAQKILGVQDADDVLGFALPQRDARDLGLEHGLHHLLRRIVGADRDHLGAVDHDVGDGEVAQIEQTAEHVAVLLLDAAFMVQEIDGSAQFLVRGEESPVDPDPKSEQAENPAHQHLDAHQQWSEQPHDPCDRTHHQQCDPIRGVDRHRLG